MIELIQGDTAEPMPVTLSINDEPVDVSAATGSDVDTVEMRWTKPDGTTSVITLVEVDDALGQFRVDWVAGDTDDVRIHRGQPFTTKDDKTESYRPIYWWVVRALGNDD